MATSTQQKQEYCHQWDCSAAAGAKRAEKKKSVIAKLKEFFDRFYYISGGEFYHFD